MWAVSPVFTLWCLDDVGMGCLSLGIWPHLDSIFWKWYPVPRLAGLVGDQVSPMEWASYLLYSCLALRDALTASLLCGCLMLAGQCCFQLYVEEKSAGDCRLLLMGLPKALGEPDSSWYYLHHTWWTASWWFALAFQWSHDPLGSGDCL